MTVKGDDFIAKKGVGQTCDYCKKKIKSDDRFAILGTYEKGKTIEEDFYHIKCWKDYYQGSIKVNEGNLKKMNEQIRQMQKQFPQLKGMFPSSMTISDDR